MRMKSIEKKSNLTSLVEGGSSAIPTIPVNNLLTLKDRKNEFMVNNTLLGTFSSWTTSVQLANLCV